MASLQSWGVEIFMRAFIKRPYNRRLLNVERQTKPKIYDAPTPHMHDKYLITTERFSGHIVYTLAPQAAVERSAKVIYYIHGGGGIDGFSSLHWSFLARLVDELHCTIVAPDYPLLPHATYTEMFEAVVLPIAQELIAQVGAAHLTLMGDSFGGLMTLALAQRLRDETNAQPEHVVLLSPLLDFSLSNPEIARLKRSDPLIVPEGVIHVGHVYAGQRDLRDPLISPIYGNLAGLGHLSVFVGNDELLVADARTLRANAEAAGVRVDYYEYRGMPHVWFLYPLPEAQHAIRRLVSILSAFDGATPQPQVNMQDISRGSNVRVH